MNQHWKKKWVEALRSGKYQQGRGWLQDRENNFCCLGVLTDIVNKELNIGFWEPGFRITGTPLMVFHPQGNEAGYAVLPPKVQQITELNSSNPEVEHATDGVHSIAYFNDNKLDFKSIADLIEEQF